MTTHTNLYGRGPRPAALAISLAACLLYLGIATTRLAAQGPYMDELHQAVGSFAYLGRPVRGPAALTFHDLPILNMRYSGAIKTAMYGLYLRIFDASFSLLSWRLVGILCVAAGLFLFGLIVGGRLRAPALAAFYFLVITDVTVVLTTRHDWGPVALALALRLVFIAAWIRGELEPRTSAGNSAWLGALAGLSLFEKLSNAVLLLPLTAMMLLSPRRRTVRHAAAAAAGGVLGALPLILANAYSFAQEGRLISLVAAEHVSAAAAPPLIGLLVNYLSLAAGSLARSFILGIPTQQLTVVSELLLISAALVWVAAGLRGARADKERLRMARTLLLCYGVVFVGFSLLRRPTSVQHWIIGAPFQYAAMALYVSALQWEPRIRLKGAPAFGAALLAAALLVTRVFGALALERSLLRGDAAPRWDLSLTRLGEFAASRSDAAVFIAPDWGVAWQMICFTNGEAGIVEELAWDWNAAQLGELVRFVRHSRRSEFYVVFSDPPYFAAPGTVEQARRDILGALPNWHEVPPEVEAANLRAATLLKFIR